MLVAEIGTFAQSVISSDSNGENQPPRKMYQALFNASLLGTCQVLGVPQGYMNYVWFLPSRKIKKLGSKISQTYLVLNPDSSN